MRALARSLLLTAVGCSLLFDGGQLDGQTPSFRARTDLIQLDVVVVDADGRAVQGLTAADFQVRDRGRPQQIAAFEEISHEVAARPNWPPDVTLDVADNTTNPDRLIVLVLDDLHFQGKTDMAKDMARRVVAGIGPRAALALVTTSGVFGIEPTENRAALLAEIDRFLDRYDPEMKRLAPGARMPAPPPIMNAMGERVVTRGPENPGRFFGDLGTYKTIENVVKKIASDAAGRRHALVWISGGMNAPGLTRCDRSDLSTRESHYCGMLGGLAEALRKSSVAVYGLSTGDFSSTLLRDVAGLSGGFVIPAGDFDRQLPRLTSDLDHYYLLGFYAEGPPDNAYRPLEVTVSRPNVTVRHRKGYRTGVRPASFKNKDPLARLSEGVLPVARLPLKLSATRLPGVAADAKMLITLEVTAPRGALLEKDQFLRDVVRYQIWAVDMQKKKVGRSIARQAALVLSPEEASNLGGDFVAFQVRTVLPLKAGRYQLRASAESAKLGTGGSVYLEEEIEDPRRSPLAIGEIILSYADGPRVPIVRGGLAADVTLTPTLDRRFATKDVLSLLCDVRSSSPGLTSVAVDLVSDDGEAVVSLATRELHRDDSGRIELRVPLRDLGPGAYRLRVRAAQGASTAQSETAFIVY